GSIFRFFATGGQNNGNTARILLDNVKAIETKASFTHDVTFNNDGIPTHVAVFNGESTTPLAPSKLGYTLVGWYIDEGLETEFNFSSVISENIELFAKWEINSYTISFEENGGSTVLDITQDYNTEVTQPTNPTKTGYDFDKWYSDIGLTTPYTFTTMPAENITLFAGWIPVEYDILYNLDGGVNDELNPDSYTIETSTITLEPATKDGYVFQGWFDNVSFTGEPITTIELGSTGEVTLYAKFVEATGETFTVTFYAVEGDTEPYDVQEIDENYFAARPISDPTRSGYAFVNWYLDGSETPFDFEMYSIVEDITIIGQWIEVFTVTFNSNGGSSVDSEYVNNGSYASEPNAPTKSTYSFGGWYTDNSTFDNPFDFDNTSINQNYDLYAKWLFAETFDNSAATASYLNGSFVGNHGVTWNYVHARNEGDYSIDGKGIMLRRLAEGSALEATFNNGILSFGFEYRKAFTGQNVRKYKIDVTANETTTTYNIPDFGGGSGADATVHNFSLEDLNLNGVVTIRIYATAVDVQATFDNFSWTEYQGE
ncbi:MAG: InlB B-repeat-containing protein, partial [Acholeplasmataceae bacterium]|nr:InlB B-repeat-containing protein [Acholeplasmataceae bacterium]